jgi:hypothetical protein
MPRRANVQLPLRVRCSTLERTMCCTLVCTLGTLETPMFSHIAMVYINRLLSLTAVKADI